jgi:hypothetical protein
MRNGILTLAGLAALLLGSAGCSSRMPILNPEPRTPQEYAQDRDECVRKHAFGVTGGSSGQCLHCELFVLCMETRMWRMDSNTVLDSVVPCCPGTERTTS